jgi:hypothetical protein
VAIIIDGGHFKEDLIMNTKTLEACLREYLAWHLAPCEFNTDVLAENIADELIRKNYCADPYIEFDNALCCPINKRREKDCRLVSCPSYKFCMMLRKEGYV